MHLPWQRHFTTKIPTNKSYKAYPSVNFTIFCKASRAITTVDIAHSITSTSTACRMFAFLPHTICLYTASNWRAW